MDLEFKDEDHGTWVDSACTNFKDMDFPYAPKRISKDGNLEFNICGVWKEYRPKNPEDRLTFAVWISQIVKT